MKLRKIVLSVLVIFLVFTANAQKIKIKKNEVLVDGKAISKFVVDGEDYVFTDLNDDSKKFKVDFKSIRRDKKIIKKWLVVTNKDKSKSSEIEMEYLSITMSNKKAVAELFFKKYNILTLTGIDTQALDAFFDVERPSQSEIATAIVNGDIENQKKLNNLNINVDTKAKRIFKGQIPYSSSKADERKRNANVIKNLIGTYNLSNTTDSFDPGIITIYDLAKRKIAIAKDNGIKDFKVTLPYSKSEFTYTVRNNYRKNSFDEAKFIIELTQQLFSNNVTLGNQISEIKQENSLAKTEQKKEAFEDFKKNSRNIYFTKGYIIDAKKGKREGEIQFIVQKPKTKSGIADLDMATLGQRVTLKYLNKKNKTRFDDFRSKSEEKFCISNEDESERCFIGLRAKGKGVELAARGLSSLSFDTSYYYEIIKENGNIGIYKDITFDSGGYLVKIAKEKKALQFNTKNKDKNIEHFEEYFNGSINTNDVEDFDFSNEKDVLKLLELYKN